MNFYEKLDQFFEEIKSLGFWRRLFNWKPIQKLSYDAFDAYKRLSADALNSEDQKKSLLNKIDLLNSENSHLQENSAQLKSTFDIANTKLTSVENALSSVKESLASKEEQLKQSENKTAEQRAEVNSLKAKIVDLQNEINSLKEENVVFKKTASSHDEDFSRKIATLQAIQERVHNEREEEKKVQQAEEIKKLEGMKETWAKHESLVKEKIKIICQKLTIDYVDNVPFKGTPDNVIKICDEFVIFDAKSPSSDKLDNFPSYIKLQAESVKKYIKQENVRKDIFLVIPSNAVGVIQGFTHNMGDYNVYVVTLDVLEPLLLCLKKIEDYEFVDQLTPEERESICRIIGKFTNITKRKIQIDHFFTQEFLAILAKCENSLPNDLLVKVNEFETSEKLNPPQEKRAKKISLLDLNEDANKLKKNIDHLLPSEDGSKMDLFK
ncbi:MAG TPA: hypothetical protein PLY88_06620 [Candidatus Omnitrophota bacterium]|nr:hypothetical protein [Candidatus Omnitrophota bacterium]